MKRLIRLIISCLLYSSMLFCDNAHDNNSVKAEKKFLKKRLKRDPHNQLYIFDLAQIFKDSKKYDKAIKLYNKSKLLDGEKGWYSEFMLGRCYELKGDSENALKYYNAAFERRPSRAEPLYYIAQYYFSKNKHSEVCFYASKGRKIPWPKDDSLFIESEVYRYKFCEQLSVVAFYDKEYRHQGAKYIDELLRDPKVPKHVKDNCWKNLLYYVENIKNVQFTPMQVNTPLLCDWSIERYKPHNPSIIKTDKGYIVNCRSINCMQWYPNYLVIDGTKIPKTKNVFLEYDKDLNKCFESQVAEHSSLVQYPSRTQGLEDLRIFPYKNEIYFVATTCQLNAKGIPKMALGKFERDINNNSVSINKITLLQGPALERAEKNWMPLVINDELFLIYGYHPYIVYKCNLETGECKEFMNKDSGFDFARFAGSAPPIPFDDGYLLMVHEGIWLDRKYYVHRFVYLDKNFEIKKVSRPFTFKHKGIEMCCGMVINHSEDKLIMTIALEDREAYFALMNLTDLRNLLKPLIKNK